WKGDGGRAAEIGYRLTGSSDLYASSGRKPSASINFITTHDGSTLHDLVTYQAKHNEANGEGNRDGSDHELAWNCGVEGATDDPAILELRNRQQRNLLLTLFLSQGTPMLLGGDEFGRTQRGNNNAYCQDNELTWYDWNWSAEQRKLFEFVKRVLHVRRTHPALHRAHFFQGRSIIRDVQDIRWLRHDGNPMSQRDWANPVTSSFGMFLAGRGIDDSDEQGRPLVDDDLLILINASHVDLDFLVPPLPNVNGNWQLLIDTADDESAEECIAGASTRLNARSMKFFRAPSRVVRKGGAMHSLGATYRMQLTPEFRFEHAAEIVDYLARLGISDVYSSPVLEAASGSQHGYDVIDYSQLRTALGGRVAFDGWTERLRAHQLGLLLDWVPNHMGIAAGQNRWWDDVLENGPSSAYAEHFDIDWNSLKPGLSDRVLLPILGQQYGDVLEAGEFEVVWTGQVFRLRYHEHSLPLGPKTLTPVMEALCASSGLPDDSPAREELESILSAMRHLPDRREHSAAARRERGREKEVIKRRLRSLLESSPPLRGALERVLCALNGRVGDPRSFDRLDELLGAQSYRLAAWRVASEEINYRRFFDVNGLAAIRMESPAVFEQSHALLFELIHAEQIGALRVDHTDGLYDPLGYFEALQGRFRGGRRDLEFGPDDLARPVPVLVEKILERGETLPDTWPVDGTTGYEFAAAAEGVLVDSRAEKAFSTLYESFCGETLSYAAHVYASKRHILRYSLGSEVAMLGRSLERIANVNRRWRDFTLISLTRALMEVLVAFPVYRTYLREGSTPSDYDERCVREAVRAASRNNPSISRSVFAFLEDVLLLRTPESDAEREEHERFALRFQQLSGPVKAKAEEDTAFYRYNRLVCLNEVGNDPGRFGHGIEEFHRQNAERARAWPLGMVTTSTHDSKRGEDTSARIAVLSELPDLWRRAVRAFSD
ncbi:MAG TPA: malto-oligosyltrehalose synthase, partial [Polyangiales bacterium]|nr:malto-oligosyltrehalose synthase [Polyangiales bacterium]